MTIRRSLSLLVGLLMLAAAVDVRAALAGCTDEGAVCCCTSGDANDTDRTCCCGDRPEILRCCDDEAERPASDPLAASRTTNEHPPTLPIIARFQERIAHLFTAPPRAVPDIPDILAVERRHTYLRIASLLI